MADKFDTQFIQATISKLLSEVARQLAFFLEKVLPSLFEDWWKQAILNSLSFQQRRRMEQRGLGSLGALDLAALLRVLDQNWYQKSFLATKNHVAEFEPGQIVSVKSNPSVRGAVISVLTGKPENRFKVFVTGETQTYYASQLQAEDIRDDEVGSLPCEQFHA